MVTQIKSVEIWDEFHATRSPELREKLVLQSVPLVHHLLGRMAVSHDMSIDYEDLAHQGLIGLIEAVDHFDPTYNTRFSTYAAMRIRGKILDYLRDSDWISRDARRRIHLIQKTINVLWAESSREPTEEEIAARIGKNVSEVQRGLVDLNRTLVSLETVTTDQDSALQEGLDCEEHANPADIFEKETMLAEMVSAIENLTEREQLVLSLYYNEELTFKEIGRIMSITESRACQIHGQTIIFLKAMMNRE